MSIIKRLQRLEKFWFGLVFDIPSRSLRFSLWERNTGALSELFGKDSKLSSENLKSVKSGTYLWNPENKETTAIIKEILPDFKIPENIESTLYSVSQALRDMEWKTIPGFTSTLSSLQNPRLRTPLCVIKGFFKDKPLKIFIPCAGKSFDFDTAFKLWAHYETDIPLSEGLEYTVEGYVVDDSDKMNEFFQGKKLSVITSGAVQNTGVYIRGIEDLKKYLVFIVESPKSIDMKQELPGSIEIKLIESGKSIII